jgi:phosphomannomutase
MAEQPTGIDKDPRRAVFKAYDIRGVYGELIDESLAERIGAATARFLAAKSLVVSHDMRPSSVPLADAMIKGILETGCDVLDAGCISTDANYFAIANYERHGGIQITASHNPAEYNGFKISREQAIPLSYDQGLADIEELALGPQPTPTGERGQLEQRDVVADFGRHVVSFVKEIRPLHLVIDAGNGMAGVMLPPVLAELPVRTTNLYFEPDGSFPNHEANPLKSENLADLREAVRREGADMGVAFDGDADRCILVDGNADIVPCDLLTALMAGYLLDRHGPSAIVYDVRSSRVVAEEVEKHGGTPIRDRVGHSFLKATMRKHNALMGGELSGHFYWRDNFFADSGMITMIQALNIISDRDKPLSELLKPLQRYAATGEINFDVEDKSGTIERLAESFEDGDQDRLDGLTVAYEDWWFNVRPSNTEPKLRLNLEAATPDLMAEKKTAVEAVIRG